MPFMMTTIKEHLTDGVSERSGNYINQQYSGHGDQQSFQPGQNPNYNERRYSKN